MRHASGHGRGQTDRAGDDPEGERRRLGYGRGLECGVAVGLDEVQKARGRPVRIDVSGWINAGPLTGPSDEVRSYPGAAP